MGERQKAGKVQEDVRCEEVGMWEGGEMGRCKKEGSPPKKHIKKTPLVVAHPSNVSHCRAATVVLFFGGPKPSLTENEA
ncbi:hypothetical protein PoB_007347600 [Plakobranchus ocellatus]|uniref:Uncharacterized protein n=1 Tax=Plakobranchus ocellatus TaxID=259542 RepID=A0AAV4DSA2_9GAST|nr:hypothetical protein PoB_007347600 [Plakobranchus ocellatus]